MRRGFICAIIILLILFVGVAIIETVGASAEGDVYLEAIICNSGIQAERDDVLLSAVSISSNEDKDDKDDENVTYKNLGTYRLFEGDQGLTGLHYIENANYFLANPKHHENDKSDNSQGTCTTVALQILVGYHNYYSDRRLIPEVNAKGMRLLEDNYGILNEHPIIDSNTWPKFGRDSIGTSDNVYERIFEETFWGSFPGLGQAIGSVTTATKNFLNEDSALDNWTLESGTYKQEEVKAELNAGRPVVVGFKVLGDHTSHVIVAYGYATYNGELCYIAHYGWESGTVQMLVPESWLGYQVTMKVDHTHTFRDMGQTYRSGTHAYRAMECEDCGCTTLVDFSTALFSGGSGTVADPYLISSAEQFRNINYAYTSVYVPRQGMENRITYSFRLTQSITIPGDWTPFSYKFTGDFDGDGKYISYSMNLAQADIDESPYQGLFGFVLETGTIHDLELMSCSITSDTKTELTTSAAGVNIGILAGSVSGAGGISNVTVTDPNINCKISGASIGALAGSIRSTSVTNCTVRKLNDKSISNITNNTRGYLGGMAGLGDIERFSNCNITITLTNTAFDEEKDKMGKVVGEDGDTVPAGITANVTMEKGGECVAEGTLITLVDGTQKAVEDLTGEEMLLVWNLFTGEFDAAPILFIDSDPAGAYEVVRLSFSDGTEVKVIYEHGFWDCTLNEYVYLDGDAAQYLGHWFLKQTTDEDGELVTARVQLTQVTITQEYTAAYSPVTYGHFCYFVNGMLSMPGGIEGMFNIFEVDAETMQYDEAQMQADIAQYGLFTYEEFAQLYPVPEEMFEACGGQYLKVALGKGLITGEGLEQLIARYAEFFAS